MATATQKSSSKRASAQKRAAQKAEEVAKLLHSFAATLMALDAGKVGVRAPAPTPRNWWKLQAGRFKDDDSFQDFAARVRAARKEND